MALTHSTVKFRSGAVLLLLAVAAQACALTHSVSAPRAAAAHMAQHPPGYLGIGFRDANGRGVEVMMVDHDGPAGKAGLRPHDVVLSVNGQAVKNSDALSRMIHEAAPGATVTLVMQRDGKTTSVTVQLADRLEIERTVRAKVSAADTQTEESDPPVTVFAESFTADSAQPATVPRTQGFLGSVLHGTPFTGLGLQTMEPQLADFFGDTQGFGLLVQMVMPDSPAAVCGLRAGDVVLRVDTVALHSAADWNKRLRGNQGQPMELDVLRDKHEITVTLTPEAKHHSMLEWPQMFQTLR